MLVLIGVAPAGFVVNMNASGYDITRTRDALNHVENYFQQHGDAIKHVIDMSPVIPTPAEVKSQPQEFHCDANRAMMALQQAQR